MLAPHPDDEVLMAAGVLFRATHAGQRAVVAVMTNGDYTCTRDGFAREAETVAAVDLLGVPENDVFFLGYPDGHLSRLGTRTLNPVERRRQNGRCERASHTYANRGHQRVDVATQHRGAPNSYTVLNAVDDLAWLLARLRPREVYVSHGIDDHPDHAATYTILRRALDLGALGDTVRVHRAIVHAGPCWPNGRAHAGACPEVQLATQSPLPALPDPLAPYAPTERVALPSEMRGATEREHLKARAIAAYPSQTGPNPYGDWLMSFARADEAFYTETLVREGTRLVRARGVDRTAAYRTEIDPAEGRRSVRVLRASDGSLVRALRLPHDALDGLPPRIEHRADQRADEGNVTEIQVWMQGSFLGLAIDAPTP